MCPRRNGQKKEMRFDSWELWTYVVYIWIISILGNILIRTRTNNWNNKGTQIIALIGIALYILWSLIYPLLRLAISRKREFLADLGSVELTKDTEAMISALQKISWHSAVPSSNENMAMFFIDSPATTKIEGNKIFKTSSIRDTHPSIDERIAALKNY